MPTIIGITESKIDNSVLDEEIKIEGYEILRMDRNSFGGGVVCYIKVGTAYDRKSDFSDEIENVFLNIFLPKSKPILVGIIYKPPDQTDFVTKFSAAIDNTKNFDANETYILGDLNFDLLKKEETFYIKKYKEFCQMYGLKQIINQPTRITENSTTLLDHILTNSKDRISQHGIINTGLSDHQLIYCTRKIIREKFNEHKDIQIRSLKNYSQEIYIQALKDINFPDYSQYDDPNKAYDDFLAKTTQVIDQVAPIKKIRVKGNNQEWFDNEVHEAIRCRDKLFCTFKKTKFHHHNIKYKKARNYAQRLIERKKKQFIIGQLEENIGRPKDLWKSLKDLGFSKNKNPDSKTCLQNKEELCFDAKKNSNTFMEFFSNLAADLVKKLPRPPNKFGIETVKRYYKNYNLEKKNFTLNQVTEEAVLELLLSVNTSKAAGLDNLSGKFLKEGAPVLVTSITSICNLSIKHSIFPEKCKNAKLKPLYKKGLKTEPKNYRPISLLPLVSKIIERIIYEQTKIFLEKNKILYKYQSGFRSNHSTNVCLSYLTNKILKGFDDGKITGMILIDLQKAFDTIDHKILLDKMRYLGFSQSSINWFRSYLTNRTFTVQLGVERSNPGCLTCGVPQGSILGPLLFLLYVNDMPQSVSCDLLLYADDSCLVFSDSNIDKIEAQLNKDFNSICDWFVDNKLSIHFGEDKTKSIVFGSKNKLKSTRELHITHGDINIKQHSEVTYLGCILDDTLSGESMAKHAMGKINGKLKFLYRQQKYLNYSLRRLLANALIQPHFDYACLAWYPNLNTGLKTKVQTMQNKCIRFCLKLGNRTHIGIAEFNIINWLPTGKRFEQCVCVNIFNFFAGTAPAYVCEMYHPVEQSRVTRRSLKKLCLPNQKTNRGMRTLSYIGPRLWNNLPMKIKAALNVNAFKHQIKEQFFKDLRSSEESIYHYI